MLYEYHAVDGLGSFNDVFVQLEKKEQYKKYFDHLYKHQIKFSRRQQLAYCIVSQALPPRVAAIYTWVERMFPFRESQYRTLKSWKGNIRHVLSLNDEFQQRKIEIGAQGKRMAIYSVWTLVPSKLYEARILENIDQIDYSSSLE